MDRAGKPAKFESAKLSPWRTAASTLSHVVQKPPGGSSPSGDGWAVGPQLLTQ